MAKNWYRGIKKLVGAMRPHKTMSPEELREALRNRPESYGGRPRRGYSASDSIRLNSYGELLEEPAEPISERQSSGQKYGKHEGKYVAASGKYPSIIPVDVDKNGRIRQIVYAGKNGELYTSEKSAKKYGSNPSKKETDRVPVRITRRGVLEKIAAAASIVGILGGLFFLSPNLTGNAVAGMNITNANFIGAGLMLIGLFAGYFYLRSKK